MELFAGAGGMALGMEEAGWAHVALYERDPRCCATLRRNRPAWAVRECDLSAIDWTAEGLGPVDLLCGGPPCQPYSEGGHGKGAEDERDGWPWALDAVRALRPTWVCFENVPAMHGTPELAHVLAVARTRFNWVDLWLLDAAEYGVPQVRQRLFVVAGPRRAERPKRTHAPIFGSLIGIGRTVSVRKALALPACATGIRRGHGFVPDRMADLDVPSTTLTSQAFGCGTDLRLNDSPGFTPREQAILDASPKDAYGRVVDRPPDGWKWPGRFGDDGMRRLTEAELTILSGFPHAWWFAGPPTVRAKMRGNAVPPPLARAVGMALATAAVRPG